jgi:hypothetical protein
MNHYIGRGNRVVCLIGLIGIVSLIGLVSWIGFAVNKGVIWQG